MWHLKKYFTKDSFFMKQDPIEERSLKILDIIGLTNDIKNEFKNI